MGRALDKESSFPANLPCDFEQVTPHLEPYLSQGELGLPKHMVRDKLNHNHLGVVCLEYRFLGLPHRVLHNQYLWVRLWNLNF